MEKAMSGVNIKFHRLSSSRIVWIEKMAEELGTVSTVAGDIDKLFIIHRCIMWESHSGNG